MPSHPAESAPSLRDTLRMALALAAPFWRAPDHGRERLLLGLLLASKFAIVGLCLAQNHWYGTFYSTLQARDGQGFLQQVLLFGAIGLSYAGILAASTWLSGLIKARWRAALTATLVSDWLKGAFWRSKFDNGGLDQPEQRMSADAETFVSLTLDLVIGALDVGTSLIAFTGVLASLSGTLTLGGIAIPGYMVIGAYAFTLLSSLAAHALGRPLALFHANVSRGEADLRAALARVAEHSESIAFHRGGAREDERIGARIGALRSVLLAGLKREGALHLFGNAHGQGAIILPFLLASPRFLAGEMSFGDVMQVAAAFGAVTACLNYFIHSYGQIARWSAATARVHAFSRAIAAAPPASTLHMADADGLAVEDLHLRAPDGRHLARNLHLSARPGEALLIRGPSGAGKSTLLRALAGLWPYSQGRVALAHHAAMFLPQKPYVPPGTLKAAACYPMSADEIDDETVAQALVAAGLPGFALMLNEDASWSTILSGGEQQRLAFARVLVAKPEIVFLDEATSALDEPTEKRLYEALLQAPWRKTLVSVGHRSTLLALHDRTLDLERAC